jgi:hypothetical protein
VSEIEAMTAADIFGLGVAFALPELSIPQRIGYTFINEMQGVDVQSRRG